MVVRALNGTDRHDQAYGGTWTWWVAVAISALLALVAFMTPARGDEPDVYAPVIAESIRAWPRVNTWSVSYGISPIYLWLGGGVGWLLKVPPHLAGRLLSLVAWCAAMFACFSGRRLVRPIAAFALLNPFVLIFAVRAHPYLCALGFAWGGWLLAGRSTGTRAAFAFAAANLHNFTLPVIGFGALLGWSRGLRGLVKPALIVGASVLGVVASWVLYGGIFPAGFHQSPFYQSYGASPVFDVGYLPLIAGFTGLLLLCFGAGPIRLRPAIAYAVAGVAVALATLPRHPPIGPLFDTAAHVRHGIPRLMAIAVGSLAVGLARLQQRPWETRAGLAALALQLGAVPFLYERYAWFGIVPLVMVWSTVQPPATPRAIHALYVAANLAGAIVYLRYGSL